MTEPVSLADLPAHLRIDDDDTSEDDLLGAMITAARRRIEIYLNRSVIGGQRAIALDAFPHGGGLGAYFRGDSVSGQHFRHQALYIELPGGAVQSVDEISYIDSAGTVQTIDAAAYSYNLVAKPVRIAPVALRWPFVALLPGAVTITYTLAPLGDDDLEVVGQAIRLTIGHWYRNREAVAVDVRGTPIELPLTVTWLLSDLRISPVR